MKGRSEIFREWTQELKKNIRKNMKIPRKKEKSEQSVTVLRITRSPT
jgi:hypothetical protein